MSMWRPGMLGLALLAMATISHASAQTAPIIGYVAAKNADPKRLEVLRQGLTDLVTSRGRISVSNTGKPS